MSKKERVAVGRITGVFGVKGWVRVFSYTQPRDNILSYQSWMVGKDNVWNAMKVAEGQQHSKGIIARLESIDDRDSAAGLMGLDIEVLRQQFAETAPGEYYWTDLEGLQVRNKDGVELGKVDHLLETGANDVLVVVGEKECLIPYVSDKVVLEVNIEEGWIRVDWDMDN